MANDLREHFARLDWVSNETATLEYEIAEYLASQPIEVRFHYDLGSGSRIYKAYQTKEPPKGIQIRTGTIMNEMRAILDALAVTLAIRNHATKLDDIYFPTAKSKEGFSDKRVRDKMKRLSQADQAIIANLKPYPGGNDLLYTLHSADIIRKHQRLVLSSTQPDEMTMGNDGGWTLDGTRIDRIEYVKGPIGNGLFLAKLAPDYHIDFKMTGEIAFSEPPHIQGKNVLTTLREFSSLVHSILKIFD